MSYIKRIEVRETVPEGHEQCPECKGNGRIRFKWSEPSFTNNPSESDYMNCMLCLGKGYIKKVKCPRCGEPLSIELISEYDEGIAEQNQRNAKAGRIGCVAPWHNVEYWTCICGYKKPKKETYLDVIGDLIERRK